MSELVQVIEHEPDFFSTEKPQDSAALLESIGVAADKAATPRAPFAFKMDEMSSFDIFLKNASVFVKEPLTETEIISAPSCLDDISHDDVGLKVIVRSSSSSTLVYCCRAGHLLSSESVEGTAVHHVRCS